MRSPSAFFCLPTSLLLLTSGYLADALCLEAQWPYNLPPHMKYFPNDEPLVRRNGEIQERIARQSPSAVRRMSTDEGEMFLLEYWQFADELGGSADIAGSLSRRNINCKGLLADSWVNKTTAGCLQPPLLSHESERVRKASLLARYLPPAVARLYARDFVCPSGTSNCSSIGQPNSCCGIGLTCNTVPDTGLGVVGCCAGSSCAGQVATCPEGYGTCPSSQGGGCCIPGYVCSGVGCMSSIQSFQYDFLANHVRRCSCFNSNSGSVPDYIRFCTSRYEHHRFGDCHYYINAHCLSRLDYDFYNVNSLPLCLDHLLFGLPILPSKSRWGLLLQ